MEEVPEKKVSNRRQVICLLIVFGFGIAEGFNILTRCFYDEHSKKQNTCFQDFLHNASLTNKIIFYGLLIAGVVLLFVLKSKVKEYIKTKTLEEIAQEESIINDRFSPEGKRKNIIYTIIGFILAGLLMTYIYFYF